MIHPAQGVLKVMNHLKSVTRQATKEDATNNRERKKTITGHPYKKAGISTNHENQRIKE